MRSSLSSDQNHFWLDVWLFAKSIWSISKVTRAIAKVTRFRCEKVWTGRMSSVLISSENRYGRQNHSRSDTFLLICNKRQRKFPPPPPVYSLRFYLRAAKEIPITSLATKVFFAIVWNACRVLTEDYSIIYFHRVITRCTRAWNSILDRTNAILQNRWAHRAI